MPVFEAKNLDIEFEDSAFLAAILHSSAQARSRALTRGRGRAARGAMIADPAATEPRFPMPAGETRVETQTL